MGEEAPQFLGCPKCGSGNVVGYQGIWECMDCQYKFRLVTPYSREHVRSPSSSVSRGKWIAVLTIVFLFGLFLGYALGTLNLLFVTATSKSSASTTQSSIYSSYISPSIPGKSIREIPPSPGYFKAFEVEVFRIELKAVSETYNFSFYEAPYGYKYVIVEGSLTNIGSRTLYFGDLIPFVYLRTTSDREYEGRFYTKVNGDYIPLHSISFPDQEPGQKLPLIIVFEEVIDIEHPRELIFWFTIREQNLEYRVYLS